MDFQNNTSSSWLDKPLSNFLPKVNLEAALVILILAAAVVTRFYDLGARVVSHDEVNHVVPAYSLYRGNGYAYDPVTHGPLQFHMMALSYFLFGDSDFSSRIPAALFSIATVAVALIGFRRYLGRTGAILAGLLILISPYMLFYGRYARNEAYGALWTLLTIYGALRYLEKGEKSILYLLTVVMALHATDKATSFIYTAQLMLFMGFVFIAGVLRRQWANPVVRSRFLLIICGAVLLLLAAVGVGVLNAAKEPGLAGGEVSAVQTTSGAAALVELLLVGLALVAAVYAVYLLVRNVGWAGIRQQRSFDLIMLAGTLILPQLTAFPVRMLGWNPLDYTTDGMAKTAIFLILFSVVAVILGLWWKPRFWIRAAVIYYAIFIVFYTTFFTNGKGFFMGLVAALGYWLSQQGVQRGGQPLYYYALIQIPIYEYLAALGSMVALVVGFRHRLFSHLPGFAPAHQPKAVEESLNELIASGEIVEDAPILPEETDADGAAHGEEPVGVSHLPAWLQSTMAAEVIQPREDEPPQRVPVLALLLYWSLTSLAAYSLAGEKMPWLTVHIAAAMLLAAGWGLGYLADITPWKELTRRRGLFVVLLLPVFIASLAIVIKTAFFGSPLPFSGNTIEALSSTSNFLLGMVGLAGSTAGLLFLLADWAPKNILRLLVAAAFVFLGVLTARAAYTAAFINYDLATEFLVYAHAARGPKDILEQIEEISKRTTGGLDVVIAYDNESNYPYWWYLRNYPNKKYYGDNPGRDVRDAPLIVVGDPNYGKIEPLVKDNYIMFEYMRLWWPMQDYWNLTPQRIWNAFSNSNWRQALFNIWMNRDYTLYAQLSGSTSLTLTTWSPAAKMRLYIRKDVAAKMWNYGAVPAVTGSGIGDPYEKAMVKMASDRYFGSFGNAPGQFNAPRGVAVATDGTIYVADSRNHRIQHLTSDGKVLQSWGTFADQAKGQAPGGTFNEPWGIAVGLDGSVYVTDTWNHRVQKFTAEGKFLTMWGYFGQGEKLDAFWGPRGIAIDQQGRLFVADTGNKRVVIFGPNGEPISSFGSAGMDIGQFDEPVGLAIDSQGRLYVSDTWNQRIQVFQPDSSGTSFLPLRSWDINGWYGQSLDNKPFLAVDSVGNIYAVDPDGGRVLQFDTEGKFLRGWSELIGDVVALVMPAGLAVDPQGGLWVSDASANRLVHFNLPLIPLLPQILPESSGLPQIGPLELLPTNTP